MMKNKKLAFFQETVVIAGKKSRFHLAQVLSSHDLPVWPHIEVADIVRDAARVC